MDELKRTSPFVNDPFLLVWQAFKNLYPDKGCVCHFDVIENKEDGTEVFGETCFQEDGSVLVFVNAELKIPDAVEIFAHELAHVAVGNDEGHGKAWEEAFDSIFKEYNRIGYEFFDKHDTVECLDGKQCVVT